MADEQEPSTSTGRKRKRKVNVGSGNDKSSKSSDAPKLTKAGKLRRPKKKKDKSPKVIVKCLLPSLFKDGPNKIAIIGRIEELCMQTTEICILSCLLMLNKVNDRFDNDDYDFFRRDSKEVVRECFFAVLKGHEN